MSDEPSQDDDGEREQTDNGDQRDEPESGIKAGS